MVDVTVPLATAPRRSPRPRWVLGWPMRPVVVIGPAIGIFAVTLASTWGMTRWRYPQWVQTSAALHEQLLFPGSIAAAAACFCAASLCGPRSLLALPGSARSGWRSITRHCTILTVWFAVAYLLAFVPLLVDTTERATSGGPDLLAMAIGPFGLAALIVLGYALGMIAPSPIVAPGAAVLAFVLLQLRPAGQSGLTVVRLVQGTSLRPGLAENPGVSAYRMFFLAVLVVALVLAASAAVRWRARPPQVRVRAAAYLVLPLVVAAIPVVTTPMLVVRDVAPPRVCGTTEGVEICLHEAYRNDLPAVSAVAVRVMAAAGGLGGLRAIVDTSLVGSAGARPADAVQINLSPLRDVTASVPSDIAIAATGRGACFEAPGRNGTISGLDARREEYSSQLTEWVLRQAGFPGSGSTRSADGPGSVGAAAPDTPFGGVDPGVVRTWLVEQRADLRRCSLPADQIR